MTGGSSGRRFKSCQPDHVSPTKKTRSEHWRSESCISRVSGHSGTKLPRSCQSRIAELSAEQARAGRAQFVGLRIGVDRQ